jgi:hypothetical protein
LFVVGVEKNPVSGLAGGGRETGFLVGEKQITLISTTETRFLGWLMGVEKPGFLLAKNR